MTAGASDAAEAVQALKSLALAPASLLRVFGFPGPEALDVAHRHLPEEAHILLLEPDPVLHGACGNSSGRHGATRITVILGADPAQVLATLSHHAYRLLAYGQRPLDFIAPHRQATDDGRLATLAREAAALLERTGRSLPRPPYAVLAALDRLLLFRGGFETGRARCESILRARLADTTALAEQVERARGEAENLLKELRASIAQAGNAIADALPDDARRAAGTAIARRFAAHAAAAAAQPMLAAITADINEDIKRISDRSATRPWLEEELRHALALELLLEKFLQLPAPDRTSPLFPSDDPDELELTV